MSNLTYLEKMALQFDTQLEKFHMPTNISIDVTFTNNSYDEVDVWHGTDNGALHIGYTLASQCFKYKAALEDGNSVELLDATRMVRKCVSALSNMMAAPNGGIGPEFPGTPARFVCAPENKKYHPWLFDMGPNEHPRHFNGTGKYQKWRVRLYTSRDELAGYFLGFASILKFIDPTIDDDSRWCIERVKLLVEQMIEGFKKTNWLLLGGEGEPVGSDLNPYLEGGTWQLALLRIGATANPQKYDSLYHYVASKVLSMNEANMGSTWNAFMDTYALAFGMDVIFSLIILEDNPQLQYHYIKNFETGFYNIVKYHRNPFFNMVHLAFMTLIDNPSKFENLNYDNSQIRWDILDQLWRFNTSGWGLGIRNYNLTSRPNSTRTTSLNPEIAQMGSNPKKRKWLNFFDNNIYGSLFGWLAETADFVDSEGNEKVLYDLPLTVAESSAHYFLWEHSKFFGEGGNPTGNGLFQVVPTSYLIVYWMAKAFNIV